MGVIADAVLKSGGETVGVIPENLMAREIGRKGLTKLHVVNSMHERKALMADLSDGFIALPRGFGTLEDGQRTSNCGGLTLVFFAAYQSYERYRICVTGSKHCEHGIASWAP